jgi:ATP-dependent RNA helicase DeaD
VGRNEGVRPSDIVGALANELGLPGASIGRIDIRDQSTLVQVVADFAERLGDDRWPLQVRGIETRVTRHAPPQRARRLPDPDRRAPGSIRSNASQERAPHTARKGPKAYPTHTTEARASAKPRAGAASSSKPGHTKSRSVHEGDRAERADGGQRPPRRASSR